MVREQRGTTTGLEACDLFAGLAPGAVSTLEQGCRWLRLPAGHTVFRHQDTPDAVYVVIEGAVRAFLPVEDGLEITYARFGPGDLFGELAALDGGARSADVVTLTESVIVACPRPAFLAALARDADLSLRLLVRLAGVIRQSSRRIAEISGLTEVQRVYLELLRLALPDPSGDGGWMVRPAPLHKDIAGWAGTTTDRVGRALGHLIREGVVQRRAGALAILDRRRLEAMTHDHEVPAGIA
ncbi:MAG: Crp/Fnr family transcriptional regulator [Rhodospirillaceae bacterium]